jgi:hypothetical protein
VLTNSGTGLRYEVTANQFIANWQTKGLSAGTYTVTVTLADGTIYTKAVQLAANGSSAAQLAASSNLMDTATVGALLAGDLEVYINDPSGLFTADELARIQDAVVAVDALVESYGVTVSETTDSAAANVVVDTGSTSAVGGYSDGVLGCYSPTGEITLIQGWNWYAGSDHSQIGAGQYDFQTVITHELGHALGLGESSNSASAMSGTLTPGTVIRALVGADLNVPYDEPGADGQHAAMSALASSVLSTTTSAADLNSALPRLPIRDFAGTSSAANGSHLFTLPGLIVPGMDSRQGAHGAAGDAEARTKLALERGSHGRIESGDQVEQRPIDPRNLLFEHHANLLVQGDAEMQRLTEVLAVTTEPRPLSICQAGPAWTNVAGADAETLGCRADGMSWQDELAMVADGSGDIPCWASALAGIYGLFRVWAPDSSRPERLARSLLKQE